LLLGRHTYSAAAASYELRFDAKALAGADFEAWTGSPLKLKRTEGTLDGEPADGQTLTSGLQYLILKPHKGGPSR